MSPNRRARLAGPEPRALPRPSIFLPHLPLPFIVFFSVLIMSRSWGGAGFPPARLHPRRQLRSSPAAAPFFARGGSVLRRREVPYHVPILPHPPDPSSWTHKVKNPVSCPWSSPSARRRSCSALPPHGILRHVPTARPLALRRYGTASTPEPSRIGAAWARPPHVCRRSTSARARAARWPPPGTLPRGRSPPAQGRYSRGRPCRHLRRCLLRGRRPATRHAAPSVASQLPWSSCASRNCAPRLHSAAPGHPVPIPCSPSLPLYGIPCTEGHMPGMDDFLLRGFMLSDQPLQFLCPALR